ncbi:MAG: hypothetical protein IPI60_12105 [Saprospiraceae bacterium]|nr:hypothetical protein [Saprospiraceae bacterium]
MNNNASITNNNTTASTFAAIRFLHENNGQAIIEIKDNPSVVSSNIDIPVDMVAVNGTNAAARLDLTLDNNNITNSTTTVAGLEGIVVRAGDSPAGSDVNTVCSNIRNNDLTLPVGYPRAFRVRFLDPTSFMNFQGPGPTTADNFTGNSNTTTNGTINGVGPTLTVTFGGICNVPAHAAPLSGDLVDALAIDEAGEAPEIAVYNPEEASDNENTDMGIEEPDVAFSMMAGETVIVGAPTGFNLPPTKFITIQFDVTVNDPFPTWSVFCQ